MRTPELSFFNASSLQWTFSRGQSSVLGKRASTVLSGQYISLFCVFLISWTGLLRKWHAYMSTDCLPVLCISWVVYKRWLGWCWWLIYSMCICDPYSTQHWFGTRGTELKRGNPPVLVESAIWTEGPAQHPRLLSEHKPDSMSQNEDTLLRGDMTPVAY